MIFCQHAFLSMASPNEINGILRGPDVPFGQEGRKLNVESRERNRSSTDAFLGVSFASLTLPRAVFIRVGGAHPTFANRYEMHM